ncbi:MAG TPA: integrase [Clostridiales bacterium]|nr:integrase [Clostridiales bacterium]
MDETYFDNRNKDVILKIRELRSELPSFCNEFFIGVESRTTPLTRLAYAYDLRIFFDYILSYVREFRSYTLDTFGLAELDKINQTNIESFLEYLSFYRFNDKEYKNDERAKARKLSTLRSFFKYYFNKGKLTSNMASKVPTPKIHDKEIVRLEGAEVSSLLNTVENGQKLTDRQQAYHKKVGLRDLAIVTLLLGTGIRISECVGLDIDDLDFKNNSFTVTRKGGNRKILYFPEEVSDALRKYLEEDRLLSDAETDALFLSMQKKRITVRAVENLVKKYSKLTTPLKKITPHKLRSTYGTNLYYRTNDIFVVAEALGHRDVNTTKKHYAAMSEEILRNAAEITVLRENADKDPDNHSN